jgi:hypothetical protein
VGGGSGFDGAGSDGEVEGGGLSGSSSFLRSNRQCALGFGFWALPVAAQSGEARDPK